MCRGALCRVVAVSAFRSVHSCWISAHKNLMMHSSVAIEPHISEEVVMEQTRSENLQLGRLVADALVEIKRLGYSRRSRNRYRTTWEHLIEFSRQKELGDEFSGDLAARFLEECRVKNQEVDKPDRGWRRHMVI